MAMSIHERLMYSKITIILLSAAIESTKKEGGFKSDEAYREALEAFKQSKIIVDKERELIARNRADLDTIEVNALEIERLYMENRNLFNEGDL